MNFTQYNNISSQVTIENQFNRYIYDQAIAEVRLEAGKKLDRRTEASRVTVKAKSRKADTFQMLTGLSIGFSTFVDSTDLNEATTLIKGSEALRVKHPQLATALAIQQTLIMAGQEDDIATIIALSTIGAGRPKLTERTLLKASTSVHEEINRISEAV